MIKLTRRDFARGIAAAVAVAITSSPRSGTAGTVNEPTIHLVDITEFEFSPSKLQVRPGDTVTWTNRDLVPHTVTALDESWDSGQMDQGESWSLVVSEDLVGDYFCLFHPHMRGGLAITNS